MLSSDNNTPNKSKTAGKKRSLKPQGDYVSLFNFYRLRQVKCRSSMY